MKIYLILFSIIILLIITIIFIIGIFVKRKSKLEAEISILQNKLSVQEKQSKIKKEVFDEKNVKIQKVYNLSGIDKFNTINNELHNN